MRHNTRSIKLLISISAIITSVFIFTLAALPTRVAGDEGHPAFDIHTILETGHIVNPVYPSGVGYQIQTSSVLTVLGKSYSATQWMSPVIAAGFYILFMLVIYSMWRRFTLDNLWWEFVIPIPALFIFASQFNRFLFTSHKKYTVLYFVMMVFVCTLFIRKSESDLRIVSLLFLFGGMIALNNVAWGIMYGSIIALPLLFVSHTRRLGISVVGIFWITNFSLVEYVPYISGYTSVLVVLWYKLLPGANIDLANKVSRETISGTLASSGWPTVHIFEYGFSSLWVWGSGILFIGLLSGFVTLFILYKLVNISFSNRSYIEYIVLGMNIGFFLFTLIFVVRRDIDSLRRIIPIPGIFNLVYVSISLCNTQQLGKLSNSHIGTEELKTLLFVLLIISAFLATPRMTPNNGINPYDIYMSDNEVHKVEFMIHYDGPRFYHLRSHQTLSWTLFEKKNLRPPPQPNSSILLSNKIYSSGNRGHIGWANSVKKVN